MQELFPFAMGAVIGLVIQAIRSTRIRAVALVVLCLIFGAVASYLAGELEVSMAFISVDALLVWAGALVATAAVVLWRRRASLRR